MVDTCEVLAVDDRVSAAVCDYARFVGLYVDGTLVQTMTPAVAFSLANRLMRAVVEHGYINRGR